jgi:DNA-binding CsgD family transcriptional regulator/tetratricopeptide (TPR) repeat protein
MRGDLQRAHKCYADQAWDDAYKLLVRADRDKKLGCDDLERLAWSAGLTGRDTEMLESFERLHHALVEAKQPLRAARAAFWCGFRLLGLGEAGRANGWLIRAQRILDAEGTECVERGYLLLPSAQRHLLSGDPTAAHISATAAVDVGERFDDCDLLALGRSLQGRILLQQGQVQDALELLDDAMLAVSAGETSPVVSGLVYCSVIACCQRGFVLDRAREWTAALADWCAAQPQLVTFTGRCLVHRAEILQLGGSWPDAIEEAQRACERLESAVDPEAIGDGHYLQAEIHRMRGALEAAEQSYQCASRYGGEPQPGLALLRLAQGNAEAAAAAIRRVLGATTQPLQRARFLPAFVEIMLANNDIDEARSGYVELEGLADRIATPVLGAMAAHACGAVRLAEGDAQGALEPLRRAFRVWQQIRAPYIAARIRVLIGRVCSVLGDEDTSQLEIDAARQVFVGLGADPDVAAISMTSQSPRSDGEHGLTARQLEVLRLLASGKTNKVIARELYVSERTIGRHVGDIFVKLDVSSRAAATAYAYKHKLV